MDSNNFHFKNIGLLVTHYNRNKSLERLLSSLQNLHITFGEIIVSDDGSRPEHLNKVQEIQKHFNFKLITTPINKGLGHNINKGQDAVTMPYTLYVQEDFEPKPIFANRLHEAITLMEEEKSIDMVRFYAYFKYPYLKPYKYGFSEMVFKIGYLGYRKFHCYSDHPHLRRSSFFDTFGRYREGIKGDKTEFSMAMSFLKNKGKGLFYEDFKGLFDQLNSADEPTTMKRGDLRQSTNPFISIVRAIYRNVKHSINFIFYKKI